MSDTNNIHRESIIRQWMATHRCSYEVAEAKWLEYAKGAAKRVEKSNARIAREQAKADAKVRQKELEKDPEYIRRKKQDKAVDTILEVRRSGIILAVAYIIYKLCGGTGHL